MAAVLRHIWETYDYYINVKGDPRAQEYYIINSPWPTVAVLTVYYLFIHKWGPAMMKDREPFNLNKVMVVYNALQSIANLGVVITGSYYVWAHPKTKFMCNELTYEASEYERLIMKYGIFYFSLKVVDLLDTVFMVLRKNYRQVTFLHVYHHMGMVIGCYLYLKYICNAYGAFFATINCSVHTVMYVYYLMTAYDPRLKKDIWWKKHITEFQLVQFFLLFLQTTINLFDQNCGYPKIYLVIQETQVLMMIYLFGSFYYKNYIAPNKKIE